MARPRLRRPDQPLPLRLIVGLYEFLASLRLAVVLLVLVAVVLGWATFVERQFGNQAVRFGIYGTWWFALLLALLGLNVLCAALIRFPWKAYQTGFLITHAGILILLFGCLVSSLGGIDAQMPIWEGQTGHLAFSDGLHFRLEVAGPSSRAPEPVIVPFVAGPFNWDDYPGLWWHGRREASRHCLAWFPWSLAHRDRGVLLDRDRIRLEVLQYYSDSRLEAGPALRLRANSSGRGAMTGGGHSVDAWESLELNVARVEDPHAQGRHMALGGRASLKDGTRVVYWVASSQAETDAFSRSAPRLPLGTHGQVVLVASGQPFVLPVDQMAEGQPVALGQTGLEAQLIRFDPQFLLVELRIADRGREPEKMLLLADFPEFSRQDHRHGVFGTYWFDAACVDELRSGETLDAEATGSLPLPRIDILQGTDGKLYFRAWKSPELEPPAELPTDGSAVLAMQRFGSPVALRVEQFQAHDGPGWKVVPVAFNRSKNDGLKQRRALVRLTVDGHSEQFWLAAIPPDPDAVPDEFQQRVVVGDSRRVTITLARDQIDLGFRLRLQQFQRKLDPGTSQAAYYASLVDLLPRTGSEEPLQRDILITLNHPVQFSDPRTGRSYRIYQEAFRGPFGRDHPVFQQIVAGREPRDELFMSWLTVNYDPGRGLKYFGSLLMVVGALMVFYMKGYFVRRRREPSDSLPRPALESI